MNVLVNMILVKKFLLKIYFEFPHFSLPSGNINDLIAVLQQLCFSSLNLNLIGYRAFPLIGLLENKIGS